MEDAENLWAVVFHLDFAPEFRAFDREVKRELGVLFDRLRQDGPALGRPFVDTLNGSHHANMKELRLSLKNDWYRVAFAFDPKQQAVILCGGGKGGVSQEKFYGALVAKADGRFDDWLKGEER